MSETAWQLEHEALDKIHAALADRKNGYGLTARQLADKTGLAIGYLQSILSRSECVLKRRAHHYRTWWADWSDIDEGFRPVKRRGRPPRAKQVDSAAAKELLSGRCQTNLHRVPSDPARALSAKPM